MQKNFYHYTKQKPINNTFTTFNALNLRKNLKFHFPKTAKGILNLPLL